jgi:hypothetical protein
MTHLLETIINNSRQAQAESAERDRRKAEVARAARRNELIAAFQTYIPAELRSAYNWSEPEIDDNATQIVTSMHAIIQSVPTRVEYTYHHNYYYAVLQLYATLHGQEVFTLQYTINDSGIDQTLAILPNLLERHLAKIEDRKDELLAEAARLDLVPTVIELAQTYLDQQAIADNACRQYAENTMNTHWKPWHAWSLRYTPSLIMATELEEDSIYIGNALAQPSWGHQNFIRHTTQTTVNRWGKLERMVIGALFDATEKSYTRQPGIEEGPQLYHLSIPCGRYTINLPPITNKDTIQHIKDHMPSPYKKWSDHYQTLADIEWIDMQPEAILSATAARIAAAINRNPEPF